MWGGRRGLDCIVVGLTIIYAISAYRHYCEFESRSGKEYSIQPYVIKFVIDLQQVDGFLWFPPSIKPTATI